MHCKFRELINAQIAQLVEQRTENPRVALEKAAPEGAASFIL